jgi:hypothetical protein
MPQLVTMTVVQKVVSVPSFVNLANSVTGGGNTVGIDGSRIVDPASGWRGNGQLSGVTAWDYLTVGDSYALGILDGEVSLAPAEFTDT